MTEVPEHLLQRSRARRAALGLGGDAGDAPAAVPAVAAPAASESAAVESAAPAAVPVPAEPAAPVPVAPYVEAALRRPRIPFWVTPVLAFLPIWALMYALTLDPPTPKTAGPVTMGAEVYGSCSGCHGPTGGGIGTAPKLNDGAVVAAFPEAAEQLRWIMEGTTGYQALGLTTYGDGKPVGGSGGVMPGWKDSLTAEELIAVVRHERETLGGEELDAATLTAEYDAMLAMVEENYPDRVAEFEEAIALWADLPDRLTVDLEAQPAPRQAAGMVSPPAARHDVLVIGGGPAGSAAAYWLAAAGHDVVVVEKKLFPRDKTCGDGLTPRAVHQLEEMGLAGALTSYHRYEGLRAVAHGRTLEMAWPTHPVFPSHGYVVRRCDLDTFVADHAASAGARLRTGVEAVAPLVEDGLVVGATVKVKEGPGAGTTEEIRARYVVIADGANSRFGRALGTKRNRAMPQGMAIRGYYESPLHDEPWIESALDVRDRNGASLPGYGWIFPVGNGTINVGIGLLSTFRDFTSVNTSHLMTEWAHTLPAHWQIDPDSPIAPPTGGRLPMGGSVNPKVGPTWIVVGDAAGSINPFNGEGIDYAYETGRMAASLIDECLRSGSGRPLWRYPQLLEEEYGLYFKVARLFVRVIGRPALMREMTRVGMQSRTLMEWVLRIMANLLRPDEVGPAEAVYKVAATLARVVPERDAA